MHDLPLSHDLLAIARASLLDELLPHLPAAQKYTALMIANAMAIVGREQNSVEALTKARKALLEHSGEYVEQILDEKQLCQALREGALDTKLNALLSSLRNDVVCRLQISNPKYLQAVNTISAQGAACPS